MAHENKALINIFSSPVPDNLETEYGFMCLKLKKYTYYLHFSLDKKD